MAIRRPAGWPVWLKAMFLALPLALGAVGATLAASSSPVPVAVRTTSTTTTTTRPPASWRGSQPPCKARLPGTAGTVGYGTFRTCPPKRVLIVGDSVALTMGMELGLGEENWGVLLDNQALLGCGFVTGYEVDYEGSFVEQAPRCRSEFAIWQEAVETFKPQVVVVEMGWWDSMQHLVRGQTRHLGQRWYDAAVLRRMVAFVNALDVASKPHVIFLTVPWMDPPKLPNGRSAPAASRAFHDKIDTLLAQAVKQTSTRSSLFDVAPYLTPAGHFELDVDGAQCRATDGVHMYVGAGLDFVSTRCGRALQRGLLSAIRESLAKH